MTHFARALGAARSGDPASAQRDVERIAALGEQLKAAKSEYWANEVEVMRLASLAWVSLAQGKGQRGAGPHAPGGDIEDRSEKNIVTPGRLLPARELLGDMLLELSVRRGAEGIRDVAAARAEPLSRAIRRGQAAVQSGNRDKARQYFSKL